MANLESSRAAKYPAAAAAMQHISVFDRCTRRDGPPKPGTNWPAFMNNQFGDDDAAAYAHGMTRDTSLPRPSSREIRRAEAYFFAPTPSIKWLWAASERLNWRIFLAYALGVSQSYIGDRHGISRQAVGRRLDRAFSEIQREAERHAD